jgi:hypothetical protein
VWRRRESSGAAAQGEEDSVVERRWRGVLPLTVLIVAMVAVWTQWVWSRVAPAEQARPAVFQNQTPVSHNSHNADCHARKVLL